MTIEFSSASWHKAGRAIQETAGDFKKSAEAALSGVANTGTDGLSMIDGIVAGIQPAVMEAVMDTVRGISEGLGSEGKGTVEVGDLYAAVEAEAAELGGSIPESEFY